MKARRRSKEQEDGFRVARASRSSIALALVSLGLAACRSSTPTAPSALALTGAAPQAASAEGAQGSRAETIRIAKGTLAFASRVPGAVTLQGSHGFKFEGSVISGLEPAEGCSAFNPCLPGATVPFALSWLGTDIPGTVRLQGDEFPVGSLVTGSLTLELTGSFVAPPRLSDSAAVTVPFTVSGLLSRIDGSPALQLTGHGRVTFTLEWDASTNGWAIRHSTFDFGGPPH